MKSHIIPISLIFHRFSTAAPNYQDMVHHATLGGSTTMSLKEKISRSAEAFLNVHAQNLPLQFYTSTLNGLVDLVEDEIIPTPIPMEVSNFYIQPRI